jgi:hypothetical protein
MRQQVMHKSFVMTVIARILPVLAFFLILLPPAYGSETRWFDSVSATVGKDDNSNIRISTGSVCRTGGTVRGSMAAPGLSGVTGMYHWPAGIQTTTPTARIMT